MRSTFITLVVVFFSYVLLGQTKVQMPSHVRQGEDVTFKITFDKVPNISTAVQVTITSPTGKDTTVGQGIQSGTPSVNMGITIPNDGTPGIWKLTKITVRPQPADEAPKELKLSGTLEFRVDKRGEITLPESADVSIVK